VSIIAPYTAPEFDESTLITIDVQRDVLEAQPLEVPGSSVAADAIGRLAHCFRAAGRPIVHIVRLHERDGSNVDPCRRHLVERGAAMLAPGSSGSELAPSLLPDPRTRLNSGALLAGAVQE
jgi:nicotinamidase-related amidase